MDSSINSGLVVSATSSVNAQTLATASSNSVAFSTAETTVTVHRAMTPVRQSSFSMPAPQVTTGSTSSSTSSTLSSSMIGPTVGSSHGTQNGTVASTHHAKDSIPNLCFRNVTPMDLPAVYSLEKASYPPDEAASRSKLQYRQHHAAPYFRCAVLLPDESYLIHRETSTSDPPVIPTVAVASKGKENSDDCSCMTLNQQITVVDATTTTNSSSCTSSATLTIAGGTGGEKSELNHHHQPSMNQSGIIGYITATRCHTFSKESMSVHYPTGPLLAIHSIVVDDRYRRRGVATAMIENYIKTVQNMDLKYGIEKIVLIAKANLLSFYVQNGFKVMKPSDIVHGGESWYECELELDLGGSGERGCQYWVVDSFARYHSGNPLVGRGSGNPAAVVMVNPAQLSYLSISSNAATNSTAGVTSTGFGNFGVTRGISVDSDDTFFENYSSNLYFDPEAEENIQWMKAVAKEFNLSETAFIWEYLQRDGSSSSANTQGDSTNTNNNSSSPPDGSAQYEIRYYTCNGTEVDLCGHATLGASSVVFQILATYGKKRDEMAVTFRAKHGVLLKATPANAGSAIKIFTASTKVSMEFPWKSLKEWESSEDRLMAVKMIHQVFFSNLDLADVEEKTIIYIGLEENGDDLLVELTFDAFMSLPQNVKDMNLTPLTLWNGYNRGVILTCCPQLSSDNEMATSAALTLPAVNGAMGQNIDFLSRFFAPKVGLDEDPVTGSAHCILGPYYGAKLNKRAVIGRQMSERGGIIECLLKKSGDSGYSVKKKVILSGVATTTMSGTLFI